MNLSSEDSPSGYLHYSFDLWLTLIKSNPRFKPARSRYFHRHFNRQHKPLEEVAAVFRRIDLLGNSLNECTGKNLEAEELYLLVIAELNGEALPLREVDLPALEKAMEDLVLEHHPLLYSEEVPLVLADAAPPAKHNHKSGKQYRFYKGTHVAQSAAGAPVGPLFLFPVVLR